MYSSIELFVVYKSGIEFFSAQLRNLSVNPVKVDFEGLIHLLGYIRDSKTSGLKYYADINDALVTDILRQANIKTKNHLMDSPDSSWQDCPYTGRSTGGYIIFFQGGPIDHGTHVPIPFDQSSAEREYNVECTTGMALAHFRMMIKKI